LALPGVPQGVPPSGEAALAATQVHPQPAFATALRCCKTPTAVPQDGYNFCRKSHDGLSPPIPTTATVFPVPYDEHLANRVREQLAGEEALSEQAMFGGLAFLLHGNMAVAVSRRGGLLVRLPPQEAARALAGPHT
jgi:hypothetical protein